MVTTRSMSQAKVGSYRANIQAELASKAKPRVRPAKPVKEEKKVVQEEKKTYNLRARKPRDTVVPPAPTVQAPAPTPAPNKRKRKAADASERVRDAPVSSPKRRKVRTVSAWNYYNSAYDELQEMRDEEVVDETTGEVVSRRVEKKTTWPIRGLPEKRKAVKDKAAAVPTPSPKKRKAHSAPSKSPRKKQKTVHETSEEEEVDELLTPEPTSTSEDKGKERAVSEELPVIKTEGVDRDADQGFHSAAFNMYRSRYNDYDDDDDDDDDDSDVDVSRLPRGLDDDDEYDPYLPSSSLAIATRANNDPPATVAGPSEANTTIVESHSRSSNSFSRGAPLPTATGDSSITVLTDFGGIATSRLEVTESYVPFRIRTREEQARMTQGELQRYKIQREMYKEIMETEAELREEVHRRASLGEGSSRITRYTVADGSFASHLRVSTPSFFSIYFD